MAFHDTLLDLSPRSSHAAQEIPFTPLELRVIALARSEDAATAPAPTRGWHRLLAWFRTGPTLRPLANERLEALRRLASDLWHGQDGVSSGNLALFRAAGFDDRHLHSLLRTIDRRKLEFAA